MPVPDEHIIVRGGQSPLPEAGTRFSGAHGATLDEAAAAVPHGMIRATTAGAIRRHGGAVELRPEAAYPGGPINVKTCPCHGRAGSSDIHGAISKPRPKIRPYLRKAKPLMSTAAIIYSGFYDYPLAFVVRHRNAPLLFWREFDDDLDDYPDTYKVFLLPDLSDEEVMRVWDRLPERATRRLGEVPVKDIVFDPTRRREIGTAVLDALMSREAAFA